MYDHSTSRKVPRTYLHFSCFLNCFFRAYFFMILFLSYFFFIYFLSLFVFFVVSYFLIITILLSVFWRLFFLIVYFIFFEYFILSLPFLSLSLNHKYWKSNFRYNSRLSCSACFIFYYIFCSFFWFHDYVYILTTND